MATNVNSSYYSDNVLVYAGPNNGDHTQNDGPLNYDNVGLQDISRLLEEIEFWKERLKEADPEWYYSLMEEHLNNLDNSQKTEEPKFQWEYKPKLATEWKLYDDLATETEMKSIFSSNWEFKKVERGTIIPSKKGG